MSYVRPPDIFSTSVDDELIIMDAAGEAFFSSNAVACVIWAALEVPATVDSLRDKVLQNFQGADAAQVSADIGEFLKQLQARDLVQLAKGE